MKATGILKPEYLLRPGNVIARLRYADTARLPRPMTIALHGAPFRIDPTEVIGRHILHFGLFDLLVTEALMRLAEPSECAVDVGANIGYMSRVLARAVGPQGRVIAFEPHPAIHAELLLNTAGTCVTAHQAAVSEREGTAELHVPRSFDGNHGIASLEASGDDGDMVPVQCLTLDQVLSGEPAIGVLKIDIEGHELAALRGAETLLRARRIRDIVFEEHRPENSPVVRYLADLGYALFRLEKRFTGPRLAPADAQVSLNGWESPAFLATADPARAQARLAPAGWSALARQGRPKSAGA